MQFQIQVNNLLDENYQSNLSRLKYFEYYTQSPNGRYGMYGMGRNICVKLILPF
jgi:iron complex outermembrane receptor protein